MLAILTVTGRLLINDIVNFFTIFGFYGFTDTNGDCFYKLELTIEWDRDDIAREAINAEELKVRMSHKEI